MSTPLPALLAAISSRAGSNEEPGKRIKPGKGRLSLFAIAAYSVYGVFALLVGIAIWAWLWYVWGGFTPADTAFLAAESTLLLAAAAILVIVFEIEKASKSRVNRAKRRTIEAGAAQDEPGTAR